TRFNWVKRREVFIDFRWKSEVEMRVQTRLRSWSRSRSLTLHFRNLGLVRENGRRPLQKACNDGAPNFSRIKGVAGVSQTEIVRGPEPALNVRRKQCHY